MKRLAFKMFLNEGMKMEYKKRHDDIWPEIQMLLKNSGISAYYIFIDDATNTLFATLMIDDAIQLNELSKEPIMKKWWEYMKDIMPTNHDNSPISVPLEEVFYLP
jgi:L-rhamnose mutarotase